MTVFEKLFTSGDNLIAGSLLFRGQKKDFLKLIDILNKSEYDTNSSSFEHMTIDNVREFQGLFQMKHKNKRVSVIYCDALTHDAQHALLKTIEDRTLQDACILVVPFHAMLLSTILSRMTVISLNSLDLSEKNVWLNSWLTIPTPTARRRSLVEKCGDEKNENARENFIEMLECIRPYSKSLQLRNHILTTLYLSRKSGTSVKQLYDYFCGNFSL